MKAPIAQAGGEAAFPPGCAFLFFWGLEIVKFILKKLGFRRGLDLAMRSSSAATVSLVVILPGEGLHHAMQDFSF
jgi:uncharacterized membrane protein YjjP (DUF1212 family)